MDIAVDQCLHHQQQYIGPGSCRRRGFVEHAVECALATTVNTGGINVDKLALAMGINAEHGMPRGLRLVRCDAQLLTDQAIEQGGFADVGAPGNGDGAATCTHALSEPTASAFSSSCVSTFSAAACSARRRLVPEASPSNSSDSTRHKTRNSRQCASPLVRTSW